ncbi:MAG TPA: hypothetical protein VMW30_11015 [Candidatus Paceibacterota bacterium]|nr:hypothetical protein [Candidatus Paceibacterota bacterium]
MNNTLSQIGTRNAKGSSTGPIASLIIFAVAVLGIACGSALASAATSEGPTTTPNSSAQVLQISEDAFHQDLPTISPDSNLHAPLVDPDLQKVQR